MKCERALMRAHQHVLMKLMVDTFLLSTLLTRCLELRNAAKVVLCPVACLHKFLLLLFAISCILLPLARFLFMQAHLPLFNPAVALSSCPKRLAGCQLSISVHPSPQLFIVRVKLAGDVCTDMEMPQTTGCIVRNDTAKAGVSEDKEDGIAQRATHEGYTTGSSPRTHAFT